MRRTVYWFTIGELVVLIAMATALLIRVNRFERDSDRLTAELLRAIERLGHAADRKESLPPR